MSRLSTVRESIFDEVSQRVDHIQPRKIRPIYDRVLVQDIPEDDSRRGSLWIPETCRDQSTIRRGLVIAVGKGDKFLETGFDKMRKVVRKPVQNTRGRIPMSVRPGDTILYNRRREAEFFIQGERYSLIHEEQSAYALLLGDSVIPLRDRVVVKRAESSNTTRGGLYIPDAAIPKNQEGIVVLAGSGKWNFYGERVPMEVGVGDRVLFGKAAGSEFKMGGVEHIMLSEKELLAVLQ